MSNLISLFCIIYGEPFAKAFPVKINKDDTVGDLKELIVNKRSNYFQGIDSVHLELWKVEIPMITQDKTPQEPELNEDTLGPADEIGEVFPKQPLKKHVHIIIRVPPLRLNCIISGYEMDDLIDVQLPVDSTVHMLMKAVYNKFSMALQSNNMDYSNLNLVHLSVPLSIEPRNTLLQRIQECEPLKELKDIDKISALHTCTLEEVQFVVRVIHRDEKAHNDAIQNARHAAAPSVVANSLAKLKSEQETRPIYNGRPNTRIGPPIAIYHRVFATIKHELDNLSQINPNQYLVNETAKLVERSNGIYTLEDNRSDKILKVLQNLLDVEFQMHARAYNANGVLAAESDGIATISLADGVNAIHTHLELKAELGIRGSSGLQGPLTLRKQQSSANYQRIRQTFNCPCILISVAGPYICFAGSICADIFVAESFTEYIYLGGGPYLTKRIYNLAQIFDVFRRAINDLINYYRSSPLSAQPVHARLFPNPTYIDQAPAAIRFIERFRFPGWDDTNYNRSLFIAELDGKRVLVKFCERYCERAHGIVASLDLAPRLHFFSTLRGGVKMVVMDIAKGTAAHDAFFKKSLPESVIEDLTRAIRTLHDQNYVYGDLRRPNIMVFKEGSVWRANLIDFDWAGIEGEVLYPPNLNDSGAIVWALGVARSAPILKAHDEEMLKLIHLAVGQDSQLVSIAEVN